MNKTSMNYWFPKIWKAGLPVPKTAFLKLPETAQQHVWNIFDSKTKEGSPEQNAFNVFLQKLGIMCDSLGFPCFLRTAFTSAKHSWRDTCFVPNGDKDVLTSHILEIVEFSECASIPGLPWDTWAVRELLPTEPAFIAFRGRMPIVPEFRIFAEDGKLICSHPYWPVGALEGHVHDEDNSWKLALGEHHNISAEPAVELALKASKAAPKDAWSIDILLTKKGWYVTDMALAYESWHWPDCRSAVPKMPEDPPTGKTGNGKAKTT